MGANLPRGRILVGVLDRGKKHRSEKTKKKGGTLLGQGLAGSGKQTSQTIASVARAVQASQNINFYKGALNARSNKDLTRAIKTLFDIKNSLQSRTRRIENAFQALYRNRIARREFGNNTKARAKQKGFDWLFVSTGQLFRNIKAKVLLTASMRRKKK